mmetsp:Transcript_3383/g.2879  ORF Transcript_3383/g.2879 Transcript_3383/m.2879 type:complete len:225 (-) Transcript_3383:62-736(-)|eukprot:CAMPEP_0201584420 /NCGR_PEP_ID=MMETSP0190_2-20130828/110436_1 /ASSEMBLY_ACC=CAM_ASM_000263 /TAXON_ID=37353 /ORGANISM="Rosalina sp." /LENGTH=224 /DNA_ID=CAMNT_0048028343 /DNA_START=26 /DNA_END=700 /DNA_ORIENTATION=+
MSSSKTLQSIDQFNPNDRPLVNGYSRRVEKEIVNNVPVMIMNLCLMFFSDFLDWFLKATGYTISNNKATVTNTTNANPNHPCYMSKWYESTTNTITTFNYKIETALDPSKYPIKFIVSTQTKDLIPTSSLNADIDGNVPFKYWEYSSSCDTARKHRTTTDLEATKFMQGDIVSVSLDLLENKIIFKVNNDESKQMIHDDLFYPKYKLGIIMTNAGDRIQLVGRE